MSSSCVLSSSCCASLSCAIRLSTCLPCDTIMPRVSAALWCSSATSAEMLRRTAASSVARRVLSLSLASDTSSLMCPSSSLVSFSRCAWMAAWAAASLAPVWSSSLRMASVFLCAASRSALDSAFRCTICLACFSSSAFCAALASARLLVVTAWAASALVATCLIFMSMAVMPSESFFSRSAFWFCILSLECSASVAILLRSLRSRRLSCCSCASLSRLRAASRRWLVSSRFFSSAASRRFVALFCAFASLSRSEMLFDTPSLVLSCIVLNSLSSSSIDCLRWLRSATVAERRASAADMSSLSLSVSVSFCALVASRSLPPSLDVSPLILSVSIATSASLWRCSLALVRDRSARVLVMRLSSLAEVESIFFRRSSALASRAEMPVSSLPLRCFSLSSMRLCSSALASARLCPARDSPSSRFESLPSACALNVAVSLRTSSICASCAVLLASCRAIIPLMSSPSCLSRACVSPLSVSTLPLTSSIPFLRCAATSALSLAILAKRSERALETSVSILVVSCALSDSSSDSWLLCLPVRFCQCPFSRSSISLACPTRTLMRSSSSASCLCICTSTSSV
mmetsp:Transcript_20683/g.52140  ORF Transcript_20683/g.52140 Transcript_20683/m.52140 type:complete len:575 (+) Transcript_20683:2956-4680(+)